MQNKQDRHTDITQPIPRYNSSKAETGGNAGREPEPQLPDDTVPQALEQDEIPTPVPIRVPKQGVPGENDSESVRPRTSWALRAAVGLALVISLLSLALNVVLIYNLMSVRQTAIQGLDQAIDAVDKLAGKGFHYEYHFQQTIPFSGDIPFKQDLVFPFEGDIPIKTTVQVPIDAGVLGKFVLDVPIDTTIHVDLEVPVQVDQTIHVDTEIPIDMTIPIDVQPNDPAIQDILNQARTWLVQVKESFSGSLLW